MLKKATKIIATLGPASMDKMEELIEAGVDCFRLNFSHGDGPAFEPHIRAIREASRIKKRHIPILADIQGPKIRIGKMPAEGVRLIEGNTFILTEENLEIGSESRVHTPYPYLTQDAKAGAKILLADGTIELAVLEIKPPDVICRVIMGGILYSNKGINLPGTRLTISTLTDKDRTDLAYIAKADIDMVALSFVRSAADVQEARKYLTERKVTIMAKLERPEALHRLDEILEASDGIMIARGDLGVEMEFETIPILQKKILKRSALRGKWAVVATQMLGTMVFSNRPSRAEVSDVLNAVLDGADAVMLSEESAMGKYPVAAVEAMTKIVREAEAEVLPPDIPFDPDIMSFAAGAAGAAVIAASRINAKAIVALAGSGLTALLVSKRKPNIPILALSAHVPTLRRLNVLRGVQPVAVRENSDMESQIREADRFLRENDYALPGDPVIIAAAIPIGEKKETNTIRFHKVRTEDTGPL